MLKIDKNCLYTETNEWVRVSEDDATIGIDDYSQNEFGNIVYVDLPNLEKEYKIGDAICVVESVKTASDIYTPLSGLVIEVNNELNHLPSLINNSCYNKGWLFKIKFTNRNELANLISPAKYKEYIYEYKNI